MKKLLIIFLLLNLISCNDSKSNNESKNKEETINHSNDISYEIIKEDRFEPIKVSLDIKLKEPIKEEELKKLALKLKAERPNFKKLFILYWLSEESYNSGNGAWASTHFSPDLEVKILGASKESLKELENKKVSGNILGIWRDDNEFLKSKIYLVEEDKKLLIKTVYAKDNYNDPRELGDKVSKKIEKGLVKLDLENVHGEYYLIEKNGDLGLYKEGEKFSNFKKDN